MRAASPSVPSSRPFRHDLHGAALEPGNLDPNQTVTDAAKHGLDDGGDARRGSLLDDAARLAVRRTGIDRLRHLLAFGEATFG